MDNLEASYESDIRREKKGNLDDDDDPSVFGTIIGRASPQAGEEGQTDADSRLLAANSDGRVATEVENGSVRI